MELSTRLSLNRTDVVIAKVGVLLSVLLLGLQLFASQPFLLVIPVSIGTGSGLYLLLENTHDETTARPALPRRVAAVLPSIVVLALAVLVAATYSLGTRTNAVYLLTGAIGGGIFAQILLVDDRTISPGLVLAQILAAAVTIRLSALFVTPGYVGVDIWTHTTVLIDGIAKDGSLAALAGNKYLLAPFYHVIGAAGALVLGSVRTGLYLSLGLLVPLSAIFVYATGKILLPARWALLGTALYAFSDQFIRWGMHIIPTSLGLVFFLAAVYLVTRLYAADAERWAVALLLIASLAVVFTHQVATAVLLVFLGIAAFVSVVHRTTTTDPNATRKAAAVVYVFVATLVTTIVAWASAPFSAGSTFLWRELAVVGEAFAESGFLSLAGGGSETVGGATQSTFGLFIPYIELFGFALLLAGTVLGGLLLLQWQVAPDIALTHLFTAAGLFVMVFGLSLFGVRALLPGRWIAFLYVPMAILAAVGLYYLSQNAPRRVILAAFVLLAVGYPTTMVVAEKATLDAPAFDDEYKRFAFTEAEIGAVTTLSEVDPPAADRTVGTDHPYVELFNRLGGYERSVLVLGADGPTETDTAVYRDYQATGPSTFAAPEGASGAATAGPVETRVCPPAWNKLYANSDVHLCTSGSAPTEVSE